VTRAPIGEFTNELRSLKQRSSHTYQALADALDRPVSTIHGWITGRHLPYARDSADFERLLVLLEAADTESLLTRLSRLRMFGNSGAINNPFRGLESFTEEDASVFHGREKLTQQLLDKVRFSLITDEPNPLMVIGASGSGKTSLLRAGLAASLRAEPSIGVCYSTPGDDPINSLSAAAPGQTDSADPRLRVLIIDQFEEIFQPDNAAAIDPFLDMLSKFQSDQGSAVVLGMRADFFHRAAAIPFLLGGLQNHQMLVGPMTIDEVTACITKPALGANLSVDADLLAELLSAFSLHVDATGSASALPLLSHVLYLLADRPTGNRLTLDRYRAIGGLESALRQTADEVLGGFGEQDLDACRFLFTRMVELGRDSMPTRRTATLDSVRATSGDLDVDSVIGAFAQRRLLTTDVDTVTISHEALLTAWPRLASWIDEERESMIEYRRVQDSAATWDDAGRIPDLLPRGAPLRNAARLLDDPSSATRFGHLERSFVAAGVSAAEARAAANARSMSRHLAIQSASIQAEDAALGSQLALVANLTSPTVESRSALLAATSPLPGSRFLGGPGQTALGVSADGKRVAYSNSVNHSITILDNIGGTYQRLRELQLPDDGTHVLAVALSSHGRLLASGGTGGSVTITDLLTTRTRECRRPDGHDLSGSVNALTFDASGSSLFAACGTDGIWWWRIAVDGSAEPAESIRTVGDVMDISVSVDGDLIAGSTRTGEIHLWALGATTDLIWTDRSEASDPASAVALSPRRDLLAAGYHSGRVRVWRLHGDGDPTEVDVDAAGFASWINWVEFSPDNLMLTAASSDGNVRFWNTSDLRDLRIDLRHPTVAISARFARPDTVITSAEDGTARVWRLPADASISNDVAIWSVTTDCDGRLVATASRHRAIVWEIDSFGIARATVEFVPSEGSTFSGASCIWPDGRLLAVATRTGRVMLHSVSHPNGAPLVLHGLESLVESLAVTADGSLLCGVDSSGHVQVWRVDDHGLAAAATGSCDLGSPAMDPAFTRSADRLAVALESGEVALFDVDHLGGITLTRRWPVGDSFCLGVSFHPTLPLLAAANADRTVSIWSCAGDGPPELTARLTGPGGKIMTVSFGPAGALLAAGVTDGKAWIWDTSEPSRPILVAAIQSPEQGIYALAFDPRGSRLHAAGPHHRMFSWLIDDDTAADAVRNAVGDEITPEEWANLIPTMPYSGIGMAGTVERRQV